MIYPYIIYHNQVNYIKEKNMNFQASTSNRTIM